jgi:hypothetical protein
MKTPFGRIVMRSHTAHPVGSVARLSLNLASLHIFDKASGKNRRYEHG